MTSMGDWFKRQFALPGEAPPDERSPGWKVVAPPTAAVVPGVPPGSVWKRYWDGTAWLGAFTPDAPDGYSNSPAEGSATSPPGAANSGAHAGANSPVRPIPEAITRSLKEGRSPGSAYVLTALFPGLGHLFFEQLAAGVILVLATQVTFYLGYLKSTGCYYDSSTGDQLCFPDFLDLLQWPARVALVAIWGYALFDLWRSVQDARNQSQADQV